MAAISSKAFRARERDIPRVSIYQPVHEVVIENQHPFLNRTSIEVVGGGMVQQVSEQAVIAIECAAQAIERTRGLVLQ